MTVDFEAWKQGFRTSPLFYVDTMARKLYRNKVNCLRELWRNGALACMLDGVVWDPTNAQVEIWLVYNHPLAPKCWALIIKDCGSGFTVPRVKQYLEIGPQEVDTKHRPACHCGGSQNRIGKFAGLGLNKRCRDRKSMTEGFYILTRTSSSGPVTMVEITPQVIADQNPKPVYINPDATELASYKNIKGSFTIIVIPNAVFTSADEIRETLKWCLPRKKNLAIKTFVDGVLLEAPPLANIKIDAGPFEAHLGRPKVTQAKSTGIWLCDAASGLRCALASGLVGYLPYPLARPDLEGDIFIPGLLARQDTSRTTLDDAYLNDEDETHEWEKICAVLEAKIAPEARKLLGDDDVVDPANPANKTLYYLTDWMRDCWGEVETHGGDLTEPDPNKPKPKPKSKPGQIPLPPKPPGPPGTSNGRVRGIGRKIGDEDYYFQVMSTQDPMLYAEVGIKGKVIFINPSYAIVLNHAKMDMEHKLECILGAVARYRFPNSAEDAYRYAAQLRQEMESCKRTSR